MAAQQNLKMRTDTNKRLSTKFRYIFAHWSFVNSQEILTINHPRVVFTPSLCSTVFFKDHLNPVGVSPANDMRTLTRSATVCYFDNSVCVQLDCASFAALMEISCVGFPLHSSVMSSPQHTNRLFSCRHFEIIHTVPVQPVVFAEPYCPSRVLNMRRIFPAHSWHDVTALYSGPKSSQLSQSSTFQSG